MGAVTITRFILLVAVVLLALPAAAQMSVPAYAAVTIDGLALFDADQIVEIATPPHRAIFWPTWSPDGAKLAYIISDDGWAQHLVVSDTAGGVFTLEAGPLEAGFPPAWTPDGDIIYIGQGEFPTDANDPYLASVKRIKPQADAQPVTIGKFAFAVGCGGGSPLPTDWQYWSEAGFGGANLTLAWTDYGLLHSTQCSGLGLALLDLNTGDDISLQGELPQSVNDHGQSGIGRAALSPDGQQVAAVHWMYTETGPVYELVTVDLAARTVTTIPTAVEPDQVAWGPEGTIFFSARAYVRDVLADYSRDELAALKPVIDPTIGLSGYEVSIHQVEPAAGSSQIVYSGDAYAIGRMALAADGQTLLFSQIPNLDGWVQAIVDGRLDPLAADADHRAYVPIALLILRLGSGEDAAFDGYRSQFALRPA